MFRKVLFPLLALAALTRACDVESDPDIPECIRFMLGMRNNPTNEEVVKNQKLACEVLSDLVLCVGLEADCGDFLKDQLKSMKDAPGWDNINLEECPAYIENTK